MITALWVMALLVAAGTAQNVVETPLVDGKPHRGYIESPGGGEHRYSFFSPANITSSEDLSLTLTTFSDSTHPGLYLSRESLPSPTNYTWASEGWGFGSIVLSSAEITNSSVYHVLVKCAAQCHYILTMAFFNEIALEQGVPHAGALASGHDQVYHFNTSDAPGSEILVTIVPTSTHADYEMRVSDGQISFVVAESWHTGKTCLISPVRPHTTYRVTVLALKTPLNYTLIAASSTGIQELQASVPTAGEVRAGQTAVFKINVNSPEETLVVQLTTYVGDADMYIRAAYPPTASQWDFNSSHFGNETIAISKHDREAIQHATGPYYISLVAYTQTVFTITVTEDRNSFVPLFPGIPQVGYADHKEVDQYYLDVPEKQDLNITVRVMAIYGNPDLFGKLCNEGDQTLCHFTQEMMKNPEQYNVFYSKHKTGAESIFIRHSASSCPTSRCRYVVAVSGKSQGRTRFTISADYDDNTEHRLMEGVPVKFTQQAGNYTYFKYSVFNETVMNLTVQLTPISGDPDLFVTREPKRPSNHDYEKSSTNSLALMDSVSYVRGADGLSLVNTYHIAVYSYGQVTFSLCVMERVPGKNTTIWIYSGQSQQDVLYNYTDADYRLYSFHLHYTQETKQPIRVALTPLSGSFMLYIANRPENLDWEKEIFYYDWQSNDTSSSMQSVAISISPNDQFYLLQSTYLILVQATNFTGDLTASYIITYTSGDGVTSLQEGIPFPDEVLEKSYRYYAFPIHYDHEDITITVSALNGDPDLYVSLQSNNTHPDRSNFDKRSSSYGGEVLSLEWEEGLSALCPGLPAEYTFGDPLNCMMYIAVYGYKSSVYTITVTARKDVPTLLTGESPAIGQLQKAGYRYYYSQVRSSLPLTVTLQSLNGDADLYMNLPDYSQSGKVVSEWVRPNREESEFRSQSAAQLDRIDIAAEYMLRKCSSGTCLALIGVYCFSTTPCTYSLYVSQEEAELLTEGQPRNGAVSALEYAYYIFHNNKTSTSIQITLTAISGDPDLYISRGRDSRPTSEHFEWASRGWRGETLVISANDTHFNNTESMRGYYMIAIKGVSNSSYIISVTTDPDPVLTIISGMPTHGTVPARHAVYYEYHHYSNSSLEVKLTPMSGLVSLKVTTTDRSENLPTETEFYWSSEVSGRRNVIHVNSADPHFCSGCKYVIGVFAMDTNATFILTVSPGDDIVTLMNGVPLEGNVAGGSWRYYSFSNPSESDLDFSLTNYAGNADLYVSTTETVDDTGHYNWTHASGRHVEHIHVAKIKQDPAQRDYRIGVKGVTNSSYSITVHSRDSAIALVDGWPSTYAVMLRSSDHLYFDYRVSYGESRPIQCTVRPQTAGFLPSVVGAFSSQRDAMPTLTQHDWQFSALDYDTMYRYLVFALPQKSTSGFHRIGVFGAPVEGVARDELGLFEITCTGQSPESVLRSGAVVHGTLPLSMTGQRFTVYVPEVSTLEAILVPCHGRVSLSISSNYTIYEETGPDITIVKPVDGRIVGTIVNAQGQFYVMVTPIDQDALGSDFELEVLVTPRGHNAPTKPVAGNDGLITWGLHGRSHITVSWDPVEYENGTRILTNVDYFIFATKFLEHKMNTMCSIRYSQKRNETWLVEVVPANKTLPVVAEMPTGHPVLINVVARVESETNALLTTVVYDPTEVMLRNRFGHRRFGLVLIGLVSAALVLALVALFFLYRKYKHVQRRLENEMMDIGKVASINSDQLDPDSLWEDAPKRGMAYIPFEVTKD